MLGRKKTENPLSFYKLDTVRHNVSREILKLEHISTVTVGWCQWSKLFYCVILALVCCSHWHEASSQALVCSTRPSVNLWIHKTNCAKLRVFISNPFFHTVTFAKVNPSHLLHLAATWCVTMEIIKFLFSLFLTVALGGLGVTFEKFFTVVTCCFVVLCAELAELEIRVSPEWNQIPLN